MRIFPNEAIHKFIERTDHELPFLEGAPNKLIYLSHPRSIIIDKIVKFSGCFNLPILCDLKESDFPLRKATDYF